MLSLSTSLFVMVCLFGSCTPQDTQEIILLTLEALGQKQNTILQKIDGLETKMTFIEESQRTLEERTDQQGDIRTTFQQEIRDQINTFQNMIEQEQGAIRTSIQQEIRDQITTFKNLIEQEQGDIRTSIQQEIRDQINTFQNMIEQEQGDMRTSIQQCCIRDQITTFQNLIEQNECEEGRANCSTSATCVDAINQYNCVCIQGYSGDGFTCADIDECNTNDAICGEGNSCINLPGTYGCLCHNGFIEVNNFCIDVDECSESSNVCGAEAICSNYPGNYTCTCLEGYEKEGDNCQDIDECTSDVHLCSVNATCINTKGNYTCQCLPYYYGDGFTCNDCQTELNKARKDVLDKLKLYGIDDLTPTIENELIKSLEQKEPQCGARKPIVSNCKELLDNGETASGVYTITPEGFPYGVEVYCDQETDGGGWTVILQRKRQSPQLSFIKTFEEYAAGFGDPNGEIWIGNRILHSITGDEPFTLRVDAKNLQGESRTGIWHTFSVGSQDSQFTLSVAGYSSSSTLGDALTHDKNHWANGMKFSTYDQDNDEHSGDCSGTWGKGGWWYNYCSGAKPTAPLGDTDGKGSIANWGYWERSSSSITYIAISEIQFKIRP